MKVVFYSRVFSPATGGMERFAEDLSGWLAAQGHDVTVFTQSCAPSGADRGPPYRVVRGAGVMETWLSARRADVVHVNGLSVRGIGIAVAASRRPVVTHAGHQFICPTGLAWSPRGMCAAGPGPGPCSVCPEGGLSGTGKVRIHRLAARAAASNVCVSRYLQERMVPPWSAAIYNPVSARAFSARDGGSGEEGVIAFAGRLVQEKGLDLLLRALSALPEAKLEVAGDGPMRRQWADLADELDLGRRVSFLGSLPFEGVAELYARAVLVCVPSAWGEPFGYAVAEAMAMGRPVVGTPAGALPELLGGGRGFVAEAVSAEALAQTLVEAFTDDLARQHAGERAREFAVRHLSVNALGPRYERLYKEVAG